jgi:virulence factor Mce-like protein
MTAEDRDVRLGAIVLVVGTIALLIGVTGVFRNIVSPDPTRTVRAVFGTSLQLKSGSDVRLDGVNSGKVKDFQVHPETHTTTVEMEVQEDAGKIYADARAVIRVKTVLGGAFYVDIERGTPGRPELGDAVIPESRTDYQVELDDIVNQLRDGAREGLQILPGELADTFRDHQAPKELFDTITDIAPGATTGLNALRGQDLDRDLQGVLANVSATVDALNTPRDDIRTVIEGAAATLETTANRGDDIRATLRLTPGTEREVEATLDRLRTTLDLADPLVDKLVPAADDVAPTFAALRPVLVDASGLLDRAVPLLRTLRPAVTSIAGAARRGLPMVQQLTPSVRRLDKSILPGLSEIDKGTKKSTAVMIGGTFAGLASGAGGQMDVNGHFIRFPATIGSAPLNSIPCQIYFANPDSEEFLVCQDLEEALETYLNYNPFGAVEGSDP